MRKVFNFSVQNKNELYGNVRFSSEKHHLFEKIVKDNGKNRIYILIELNFGTIKVTSW